ncbi:MAG: NifU N-terminal domain-containing protein [Acidimicrobiia bacterium]
MGQPITVTSRPGVRPDVMHFELNRSLTGMQTDRYTAVEDATGVKPPDELARRLFALGVTGVTVYSSSVTVTAAPEQWDDLRPKVEDTIVNLFLYYRDGVLPAATSESPATSSEPPAAIPAPAE